mmetsp:Transcript_48500/g.115458  ORF Transcript_48500/g.115458 Transcript_48500/m.115458 type:complete len:237 (-) Transcript_48500:562-1272(-)
MVAVVIMSPRGFTSSPKFCSFMFTSVPKIRRTCDSSGNVKLMVWNLLWKRCGRKDRPPPGGPTAPRTEQSLMYRFSCFRRSYQKPYSIQTLRSSRGGIDPNVSFWGMFMSSTNTTIFFPAGGAKVSLVLFSTAASTMSCTRLAVVCAENCIPRLMIPSGSDARTCWRREVLPHPTGPEMMTSRCERRRMVTMNALRAESTVGTCSLKKGVSGEGRHGFAVTLPSSHVVHCSFGTST